MEWAQQRTMEKQAQISVTTRCSTRPQTNTTDIENREHWRGSMPIASSDMCVFSNPKQTGRFLSLAKVTQPDSSILVKSMVEFDSLSRSDQRVICERCSGPPDTNGQSLWLSGGGAVMMSW